jgi:dolichol-phosphate mannosyltransferase
VEPVLGNGPRTTISVLVPTLNEAVRLQPCLDGLAQQGAAMIEVIVVDSGSTDGTDRVVAHASARDARLRMERDPPLPNGWIGKAWALQHGLSLARGEWILGVDADAELRPGAVNGIVEAAIVNRFDVVSFSPCFADQTAAEQLVQPSIVVGLLYRTGAAGAKRTPGSRMLANGQCFLARRETLLANDGYAVARQSFAEDVSLVRALAAAGARVGFLDGSRLYRVRSYASLGEMWREWGRSVALADARTRAGQLFDVVLLLLTQGIPVFALLAVLVAREPTALVVVNVALFAIRAMLLLPLRHSYERTRLTYWLSPLTDPLAALRVAISTFRRPTSWRGRTYVASARPV